MANLAELKGEIVQKVRCTLEAERHQDQQRRDKVGEVGSKVREY